MIRKLGEVSSDFVALGKSREKYSKVSGPNSAVTTSKHASKVEGPAFGPSGDVNIQYLIKLYCLL